MTQSTIGKGQERFNRASAASSNLDWCAISTTPTGTYSNSDGNWSYWVFKSNSSLVVTKPGLIDFLVQGGGASGGRNDFAGNRSGGGGAGGARVPFPGETIAAGTFAVTVGAGGAGQSGDATGNNGSNSSLGSDIVGLGGGGGGTSYRNGRAGGCGGGQGFWNTGVVSAITFAGVGTLYQGFAGGSTIEGNLGSGGGGTGEAGQGNSGGDDKTGGNGIVSTIISTTIATAQAVGEVSGGNFYIGGGGGGGDAGVGGLGGGTTGSTGNSASAGANTGSGSGGAKANSGAGGSGVVIVRTRI